jgi:hypothetical protein
MEIACQAVFLGPCGLPGRPFLARQLGEFHWSLVSLVELTALVDKLLNNNWLGESGAIFLRTRSLSYSIPFTPLYENASSTATALGYDRLGSHLLVAHGFIGTTIVIVMLIDSPPRKNRKSEFLGA